MSFDNVLRGLATVALSLSLISSARAQETAMRTEPARTGASSEEGRRLGEARTRIAELEARVVELEAALARKDKPEPAAASSEPAKAEPDYRVNPGDEKFMFLNLGVRKQYMAVERDRLIEQLRTMIPPLYEPAFSPFHGYTLPARAFRVSVNSDRFTNNHDFGRDKVYSLFFDKVKLQNQGVDVDLSYGLTSNSTMRLVVPLRSTIISGTGHAFRIQPMVMSMNGSGFGIGDVQLMLKHKWFDQGYKPFNLATVIGMQLPTGKNDTRFEDAQTLVMNGMPMGVSAAAGGPKLNLFSNDLRLPNSSQPGTGSWGAMFGVMGTRQLTWNRFRGALHAGALYKAMKDTDQGVRPGNELIFAASFVRPPLESEHLTFDLTFFGRNKQSERYPGLIMHPEPDANSMPIMNTDGSLKMFMTPRPPFEHGTVMFLSPSLVIIPKSSLRLTVSPLLRVYEPNQGPSPAFRFVFGATTTF